MCDFRLLVKIFTFFCTRALPPEVSLQQHEKNRTKVRKWQTACPELCESRYCAQDILPEKPYSFEASLPAVQKLQYSGGNDTFEHTSRPEEIEKNSIKTLKSSYV